MTTVVPTMMKIAFLFMRPKPARHKKCYPTLNGCITEVCLVLDTFIYLPNSLKLITGSQLVRNYNLNTYKLKHTKKRYTLS